VDPFQQVAAGLGKDFDSLMVFNANVTVKQIDPDSGTATTTVNNVPALKRVRLRQEASVGSGELGQDECRFVFAASAVSFTPKARDQIVDSDGVTVWIIESAEVIAFGQLAACNVVKKR
jgi:hypothetical protein